ncbi:MAG: ABC transporter ATP-binding protein, partial [Clostridia bacterium]|nr:ABC transporter ATP-binding protein [Clostridia bacterium]
MSRTGGHPYYPPKSSLQKPRSLRELPGYIAKLIKGFTSRLFYIISLVFESSPGLLFVMCLACLLEGVLPVVGAYITKEILNGVAELIGTESLGSIYDDLFVSLKPIIFILALYFIYMLLRRIVTKVGSMASSLAGERVVNHIKVKIMKKADEVDIPSFDKPEFYEKLENANREAGMRPIGILTATLNVISSVISLISFVVVLATLNPLAPLLIVIGAIPGAVVNYRYRYKNYRYIRFHSKERRQMNYYSGMMVNKDLAKEVRILGLGDEFAKKYKQSFTKYYKGLKKLIVTEGVTQILTGVVTTLVSFVLFLYIAYSIIFLGGEIGDWSLYTGALTSISSAVGVVLTSTATIYEGT